MRFQSQEANGENGNFLKWKSHRRDKVERAEVHVHGNAEHKTKKKRNFSARRAELKSNNKSRPRTNDIRK